MRNSYFVLAACAVISGLSSSKAQTFSDLTSYCQAMSGASTPTLMARTKGISKQQSIENMKGMTDPKSIKMVQELIEFAYSKPQNSQLEKLQSELNQLCLERKIFRP